MINNCNGDNLCGVFANGIWKSGNHLLLKLLYLLDVKEKGIGIAASSIIGEYFILRSLLRGGWFDRSPVLIGADIPVSVSKFWLRKWLLKSANSCMSGHSAYSDILLDMLNEYNFKTIQIVRDPRDVVVSLSYWIEGQKNYYAYKGLINLSRQERMQAIIKGFASGPVIIESMATILDRSYGWLTKPNDVLVTRFENLVGNSGGGSYASQRQEVASIANYIGRDIIEIDRVCDQVFGGTKTFRVGGVGAWNDEFSTATTELFKNVVGERIFHWGYNW